MRDYVVDTHVFVWWTDAPRRLARGAKRALRDVDAGRACARLPSVIGAELALLGERGRNVPAPSDLEAVTRRSANVRLVPLGLQEILEFAHLRALVDPFDRMIVATARAAGVPLITADMRIAESGLVEVIWE